MLLLMMLPDLLAAPPGGGAHTELVEPEIKDKQVKHVMLINNYARIWIILKYMLTSLTEKLFI